MTTNGPKMSESINFKLVPSQLWKLQDVYKIEKIELHQDFDPEHLLNDLSMITMETPIVLGSYREYGVLAQSSFTPKSKVSHIVTNL